MAFDAMGKKGIQKEREHEVFVFVCVFVSIRRCARVRSEKK